MAVRQSISMEHPHLCCPECGQQTPRDYTQIFDVTSFETFSDTFVCPSCHESIHPEDAYLTFLQEIPNSEVMGYAFSIGGFVEAGTKAVEVGKTTEFELFDTTLWEISDLLLAQTDLPADRSTSELDGEPFNWHIGKLLIDDQVIVDGVPVEDNSIGIITSVREQVEYDEVTVAYLAKTQIPSIRQPPWVDLLSTAARLYFRNQLVAIPPVLVSAYDNHTARQLERTLRSNGKSDSEIKSFFEEHYYWKDQAKEGLESLTGTRLPAEIPETYNKLAELRNKRDDYIVHIDANDDLARVSIEDAKEMITVVVEAILTVHELCYDVRRN